MQLRKESLKKSGLLGFEPCYPKVRNLTPSEREHTKELTLTHAFNEDPT